MARTDANHIALERTRALLNLFRKSKVWNKNPEGPLEEIEISIISRLKLSQQNLRINSSSPVDPIDVITPFITVLRAAHLSGTYKAAALETIQHFVVSNVLSQVPSRTGDALAEIVDAVYRTKYVQTDVPSDEFMQLLIIQVLHAIIRFPVRYYLTDETAWNIVESCHTVMLHTTRTQGQNMAGLVEQTLLDSVRFIFECSGSNASREGNVQCSFGLPCAMKTLGFFVKKLQKFAADVGQSKQKNTSGSVLNDNNTIDADVIELVHCLKAVHEMLMAEGDTSKTRSVVMGNPALATMVRDDLAKCLLMIASKREYPPVILQHVLTLFSTLVTTLGPVMRIMVECFFMYVYLKGLVQFNELLSAREEAVSQDDLAARFIMPPTTGFSLEELGIILESLADVILARGFLQSLFASFDCDPAKPDIVKPLLNYLNKCTRLSLLLDPQDLGNLSEISSYCVQTFLQMQRLLADRVGSGNESGGMEAIDNSLDKSTDSSSSSSSSHGMKNGTGGVDDRGDITLAERASNGSKYLIAYQKSKSILTEASRMFVEKPKTALQYLQSKEALSTPLTPESVAEFLRIAPELPKEDVGSFLGEMGKDDKVCTYEGDSKDFHKNVLLCYVKSFTLTGQSVLNSLRIFLSAFRLPGEAQQIDRILVAFSENCFEHCMEKESGIIDNSEVLYLLTFSIIMLNTDLHNPNIREDRRMTLEQFIRNNTNYGSDVNQKTPLARDYLEGIYSSVAEFQIRTEKNDSSGSVTVESWMDLQFQASLYPEKSFMLTTCYDFDFLNACKSCNYSIGDDDVHVASSSSSSSSSLSSSSSSVAMVALDPNYNLRSDVPSLTQPEDVLVKSILKKTLNTNDATSKKNVDPLSFSTYIYGADGIIDKELFLFSWRQLLEIGISPFLLHRSAPKIQSASDGSIKIPRVPGPTSLWRAIDFLVVLLKLAHRHEGYQHVVDAVILILAEFSGSIKNSRIETIVADLKLDQKTQTLVKLPVTTKGKGKLISSLVTSVSSRAALCTLLQVVHNNPMYIRQSWGAVWSTLSQMRDNALLPISMVKEVDKDPLPTLSRLEFELRMLASLKASGGKEEPKPKEKRSSAASIFSFGEFIFGGIVEDEVTLNYDEDNSPISNEKYVNRHDVGRWDSKYEEMEKLIADKVNGVVAKTDGETSEDSGAALKMAMKNLRDLVGKCGISQLVADTRFMNENILQAFVKSMIAMSEMRKGDSASDMIAAAVETKVSLVASIVYKKDPSLPALKKTIDEIMTDISPPSESSRSWMEMILVETTLRNRDRIMLIWPYISAHYAKTLGRFVSQPKPEILAIDSVNFDYTTERRVVGLLKIATKLIARKKVSNSLLELLQNIFTGAPEQKSESSISGSNSVDNHEKLQIQALSRNIMNEMGCQIATGVFSLLTLNVSILPFLTLEQWQILFDMISIAAACGGFASIKAFESMAWLLHEPRLRAEVPVFCVVAIKPLLRNAGAPESVSIGAVQLLSHLHSRLEVLTGNEKNDTPALWDQCWVPILKALAGGVTDSRQAVRVASLDALSMAILDRHASAVPPALFIKILQDIVVPTVKELCLELVKTASAKADPGGMRNRSNSEQMLLDLLAVDGENKNSLSGEVAEISSNEMPASSSSHGQETEKMPNGVLTRALSNIGQVREVNGGLAMECLSSLCKAFLRQLKRLSTHPAFDSLWQSFLDVLICLSLKPEYGGQVDEMDISQRPQLDVTVEKSYDYLVEILKSFVILGLFDGYLARWGTTFDKVLLTYRGASLLTQSFRGCSRDMPPVLPISSGVGAGSTDGSGNSEKVKSKTSTSKASGSTSNSKNTKANGSKLFK